MPQKSFASPWRQLILCFQPDRDVGARYRMLFPLAESLFSTPGAGFEARQSAPSMQERDVCGELSFAPKKKPRRVADEDAFIRYTAARSRSAILWRENANFMPPGRMIFRRLPARHRCCAYTALNALNAPSFDIFTFRGTEYFHPGPLSAFVSRLSGPTHTCH